MSSPSFALRRRRLLGASLASGALGWGSAARAVTEADIFPVVETSNGRLRGLASGGINVFKGVHYGDDTAGANRFMPPMPVKKWRGVRDATAYGNYAPQMPADRRRASVRPRATASTRPRATADRASPPSPRPPPPTVAPTAVPTAAVPPPLS